MDLTALDVRDATIASAAIVDSFLHLGDPDVGRRVAVATRVERGWDELTYEQLDERSSRVRVWLSANGVGAGDRVAILGESGNDWVAAFFGILRCGAIAVPLDTRLTADELVQIGTHSAPAAAVVSRALGKGAHALLGGSAVPPPVLTLDDVALLGPATGSDANLSPDDLAVVVWTSGTTGAAKGVCLTYANLDYSVTQSVAAQGTGTDDRWLSILSLNHMLELSCGLLATLRCASTLCFARSLMPREVVEAIRDRRITHMMVVPLVLRLLRDELACHPAVAGQLHGLFSGGASLSRELVDDYAELGIPVHQGYGLTELAPTVSMNSPEHHRPGSVGLPIEGTEVRVSDGEILVRSPGLMAGYWRDDELTATVIDDEGWFHTGDLGHVDADGYLYVTGRAKHLIVLDSAKKVQPEEVEAVLAGSDLFAEVCVVAVHAANGRLSGTEQVCAVVVPSEAAIARHGDGPELHHAMAPEVERRAVVLSGYKRPTVVEVSTVELAKTAKRSIRRAEVASLVHRRRDALQAAGS